MIFNFSEKRLGPKQIRCLFKLFSQCTNLKSFSIYISVVQMEEKEIMEGINETDNVLYLNCEKMSTQKIIEQTLNFTTLGEIEVRIVCFFEETS